MSEWLVIAAVPLAAAALSATLIVALTRWLKSHAMARPLERSSHREPTPQGGGLGVVPSTLLIAWLGIAAAADAVPFGSLAMLTAATALLMLVGLFDDMRELSPAIRLLLQFAAVGGTIAVLPHDLQLVDIAPLWLERTCLIVAGVWFVNIVNFMDGIDWMTVAEAVPLTAALALFGLCGIVPMYVTFIALALFGAVLGFAPFNRPVARLFLGDVGSLPLGLLLGWLLLQLALFGQWAAAILLPLYYLSDATLTLALRLQRGERVWQAHRTHFYQQAVTGGLTVGAVVARVLAVNGALAVLAALSIAYPGNAVALCCLLAGAALVAGLLRHFSRAGKVVQTGPGR